MPCIVCLQHEGTHVSPVCKFYDAFPFFLFLKFSVCYNLLLQDARHAAEAEIYTSLNAKIDQFLQLADYDWMAAVPGGENLAASDYLIDLIAFLKSTFSVFTNLPVSKHMNTRTHTTDFTALEHQNRGSSHSAQLKKSANLTCKYKELNNYNSAPSIHPSLHPFSIQFIQVRVVGLEPSCHRARAGEISTP